MTIPRAELLIKSTANLLGNVGPLLLRSAPFLPPRLQHVSPRHSHERDTRSPSASSSFHLQLIFLLRVASFGRVPTAALCLFSRRTNFPIPLGSNRRAPTCNFCRSAPPGALITGQLLIEWPQRMYRQFERRWSLVCLIGRCFYHLRNPSIFF